MTRVWTERCLHLALIVKLLCPKSVVYFLLLILNRLLDVWIFLHRGFACCTSRDKGTLHNRCPIIIELGVLCFLDHSRAINYSLFSCNQCSAQKVDILKELGAFGSCDPSNALMPCSLCFHFELSGLVSPNKEMKAPSAA